MIMIEVHVDGHKQLISRSYNSPVENPGKTKVRKGN